MEHRCCIYCDWPFRFEGRCKCGLTKYGMKRRTLREHRAELVVIWEFLEFHNLTCEAEDQIIRELGMSSNDLYYSPLLDCESDEDSDPEEELRGALAGERAIVEAVGNIQELQRLHGELRRAKAKIRSLEARSSQESLNHATDKCRHHSEGPGTGPGQGSRKRTADGAMHTS